MKNLKNFKNFNESIHSDIDTYNEEVYIDLNPLPGISDEDRRKELNDWTKQMRSTYSFYDENGELRDEYKNISDLEEDDEEDEKTGIFTKIKRLFFDD